MKIKTILLLPNADTRERLLAPGALLWCAVWGYGWAGTIGGELLDKDHLVLARDGKVVPEGSDRLGRCRRSPDRTATDRLIRLALDGDPDPLRLVCRDLGEVVVIERTFVEGR